MWYPLAWKSYQSVQIQKKMLEDVSEKYRNGIFELFNIIASKIDQYTQTSGFGEKIFKEGLFEFEKRVDKWKKKRD